MIILSSYIDSHPQTPKGVIATILNSWQSYSYLRLAIHIGILAMRCPINSLFETSLYRSATFRGVTKKILCVFIVVAGAMTSAKVFSIGPNLDLFRRERDTKAPVDYGSGPG